MISQSVIYTPFSRNPKAAAGILALARRHLMNIPGTETRVGLAIESDRTVNISNGKVIKTTTWKSKSEMENYFAHPQCVDYVRAVLYGWKLEDDPHTIDAGDAFINHVLRGTAHRTWERNRSIPDSEVLWGDEQILLYEWTR